MTNRIKWTIVGSSTGLVVLLLLGAVNGRATSPDDVYGHLRVYTEVLQRIKLEYVEEPDMKSVTLGALNGMLEAIDPFASYLNADQYKDYLKNKDVKRADVGLVLSKKFGFVGVVSAITGSPAAKAGFSTGDMIETINGVATRDMPLAYAAILLQGDPGSTVEINVFHVRRSEPTSVKLTRAMVPLPTVETRVLADNVGYINVDAISPALVKDIAAAVQKLQADGAKKLMLDLRNCATGSPEDGIALANLFLNKGRITYLVGQKIARQNFDADPAKAITSLPMTVLTNRGTAAAAEVAAAALMDNKRAQAVGERTYGDAAMRRALTMDDGGAIILSVAKYYSPEGKAIQDNGLTPNYVVTDTDAAVELDDNGEPLPENPTTDTGAQKKVENDPIVKKAQEVLAKLG